MKRYMEDRKGRGKKKGKGTEIDGKSLNGKNGKIGREIWRIRKKGR